MGASSGSGAAKWLYAMMTEESAGWGDSGTHESPDIQHTHCTAGPPIRSQSFHSIIEVGQLMRALESADTETRVSDDSVGEPGKTR